MDRTAKPKLLIAGALLATLFYLTPWGEQLDLLAYDTMFLLRGQQPIPDDIVFVAIDEPSFQQIAQRWPWSRAMHAQVIRNLLDGGARVVAVDILFAEPGPAQEDEALRAALDYRGRIVLAADVTTSSDSRFEFESVIEPLPLLLTGRAVAGHISNPSDSDGFVRRAALQRARIPSLALQAARAYSGDRCCRAPMPSDYYIDFAGTPPMVQTVSYYQALDPQRYLPAGTFLDKLVIIGVNTASSVMPGSRTPDHYPTPFTRWGGGYMPGSFIHANIVANLLYGAPIAFTPRPVMALVGLLLAAVYWRFTTTRDLPLRSAALAILLFLLGTAAFLAFAQLHRYVSPLGLLLPMLTIYLQSPYYDYLQASRQRAFIRGALSSYVSPQVVALIDRDPDVLRLGGTRVEGSVLFLDIAGFTTLTERHSPELIVQFINEYLSELVDIAMNAGGTVERFLGDAVMVVWGAPLAQADHARRACDAALTMVDRIRAMSAAAEQRLGAPVSARIGVNSGTMIAGNIGGNRRFNYTVMGDAVNLAARLEAANKSYRTTILIGDATRELIGEDYLCRLVDRVRVKGRAQVSALWELVGRAQAVDSDLRYALATYAVALDQYRAGNFAEAIEGFARVADLRPDDGPAAALRSRCERLLRHPPAEGWDGVVDLEK